MDAYRLPEIPSKYARIADNMRRTAKPAIDIKLTPSYENLLPWQSKIGGTPYLPLSAIYPRNYCTDQPLKLLAQINFAEAPRLAGYPEKGILQFFIDPTEEYNGLMGMHFEFPKQKQYRVLYFENVEEDISKLNTNNIFQIEGKYIINLEDGEKSKFRWPLNIDCQLSMKFELIQHYMTFKDYRTEAEIFGCNSDESWNEQCSCFEQMYEDYWEDFNGEGHRIGGYPHFIEDDPKNEYIEFREYELLFQLSCQEFKHKNCQDFKHKKIEINWGCLGVGNFFIRPQDLEKRDFSGVMYFRGTC